jgi:integrase
MPGTGWGAKRQRTAAEVLRRHLNGETGIEIAKAMGTSRGGVSTHLHAIEKLIGLAVVSPARVDGPQGPAMLAEVNPDTPRARRGSLVGWHSFRTTWTTFALSRGVPIEIVRTVTGHRTAEIVLKNYFRPGREAMREAIGGRMPAALIGDGDSKPMREQLPAWAVKAIQSAKTLKALKAALLTGAGA